MVDKSFLTAFEKPQRKIMSVLLRRGGLCRLKTFVIKKIGTVEIVHQMLELSQQLGCYNKSILCCANHQEWNHGGDSGRSMPSMLAYLLCGPCQIRSSQ